MKNPTFNTENKIFPAFRSFSEPLLNLWSQICGLLKSTSLKLKIAFFVVVFLNCTFIPLYLVTEQTINTAMVNELTKRAGAVADNVRAIAGQSIQSKDQRTLDNLVHMAKASNIDIEYISVSGMDNRVIAHSNGEMKGRAMPAQEGNLLTNKGGRTVLELLNEPVLETSSPVISSGNRVGTVKVAINKSVLTDAQKLHSRIFIIFGIILVIGTFASVMLASYLIRPIQELSAGVDELKNGMGGTLLRVHSQDELGRLTSNFNEMSSTIALQRNRLNVYARELEESYISIVKVVAAAIDARDSYTHGHSGRVSHFSVMIGEEIGLDKEALDDLKIACLFHDVGKIKTPDAILLKPGKLNQYEYREMINHVEDGASILNKAGSLRKYIPAVRHHHERYDGKGYPQGLSGDDIPLFASIIAVADTFDAMTSNRPYRNAFSIETALQELRGMSGTQLKPELVAVFVQLMSDRQAAHEDVAVNAL
ncbi:MAG TPA: HD domain-containing phosphohydrolase [Syntrophorhabdaceae bacterium]|nr:HD domain-containing phosphohydrolase [Syntrophorhabdaceae bacterium]